MRSLAELSRTTRGRLVLDGKGLGVVGGTGLNVLLAFFHLSFERDCGQILQKPRHLVRSIRTELRAGEWLCPPRRRQCSGVGPAHDHDENIRRGCRNRVCRTTVGDESIGRGGFVHDEDDQCVLGTGCVVEVPKLSVVGLRCAEAEAAPQRIPGLVQNIRR